MTTKECFKAIDKLNESGILNLVFTGGEPFIRDDMLDILSYCIRKNFFKIALLTNGTILSDEQCEFLIDNNMYFSRVRMSVFSHINAIHDGYCGVENGLAKIIDNGKKLLAGGVQTTLLLNILDFNIDTFEESQRYFEQLGFPTFLGTRKLMPTKNLQNALNPFITKDFFIKFLKNSNPLHFRGLAQSLHDAIQNKENKATLCIGLHNSVTITGKGNIIPCVSFRKLIVGNIFSPGSLSEILRSSKEYHSIRSINKSNITGCKECTYINFCTVCLGMLHSQYGKIDHVPDQLCNYAYALDELRNK